MREGLLCTTQLTDKRAILHPSVPPPNMHRRPLYPPSSHTCSGEMAGGGECEELLVTVPSQAWWMDLQHKAGNRLVKELPAQNGEVLPAIS